MKISTTKIWMGVEWKGHRSEVRRRKFNRVEDRTKLWNSLFFKGFSEDFIPEIRQFQFAICL